MKKVSFLITAIALLSFNSYAQESTEMFNFGIKGGANFSNVYDSQGEKFNADGKFGLAVGAFATIPLGKLFGIQPEVLYSERGFKAKGSVLGSDYDLTRTTGYIDIPLLLAIKPVSIVTILVGPQYSFLINEKNLFTSTVTSVQQEQTFKNDNVRKNTLCLTGGVDLNIISNIVFSARAGWDLQNNNGDGTSTTPRYKNAWYQATIGFKFL
jgi:Outer membrane protein beta-barrel domain